MRLARVLVIPLIAAVLLASAAVPAAAQTWVSLRYWPTNVNTSLSGGAPIRTWDAGMLSVGLRRDLPNNWAVSFNGDWGSQSNWAGTWVTATSGRDSMWNLNLHRNFPTATGSFSVFLGYESAGWSSVFPVVVAAQTGRYTGFRGGVDIRHQTGAWTIMAWGATGLGGTWTVDWPGVVPAPESTSGSYSEYGGTVGYMLPGGWNIDLGYRQVQISGGATTNFLAVQNRWQGWLFGVSRSFP